MSCSIGQQPEGSPQALPETSAPRHAWKETFDNLPLSPTGIAAECSSNYEFIENDLANQLASFSGPDTRAIRASDVYGSVMSSTIHS